MKTVQAKKICECCGGKAIKAKCFCSLTVCKKCFAECHGRTNQGKETA